MRRLKTWRRGLVFAIALVSMGALAMLDPAGAVDPAKRSQAGTCKPSGCDPFPCQLPPPMQHSNGCGIHMQGYPPPPAEPAPPAMRFETSSGTIRVQSIEIEIDGQSIRIDGENFGPLRSLLRRLDPPTV